MENTFQTFSLDKINKIGDTQWLIDDIIPNESLIILYGQSGCGKTFIALDMTLHIAHNIPWKKQSIVKHGIIIYCIGEGINGLSHRIKAWHDYNDCRLNAPFVILPIDAISFAEQGNIDKMVATIEEIQEQYQLPISMIVIDTLSKASVGYDENSSKDMGLFLYNFDIIKKYFKTSIMFIHHSGKNSYKGMRGSSYLLGSVDTVIQVDNIDNIILVQIEKQKDGIEGSFQLKFKLYNDTLVVYNNDINLKFREKRGFIVDIELKESDITNILEMLKENKSFEEISKKYKIDITKLKKYIKKYLLKKDEIDANIIITKYNITDEKVMNWIKENFKCYEESETETV